VNQGHPPTPRTLKAPAAQPLEAGALSPRLGALLDALAGVNQRLVGLCEEHRAALRKADASHLADVNARHAAALAELKAIDGERRKLTASAASSFGSALRRSKGGEPTLSDLVAVLPDSQRPVLMAKVEELRRLATLVERSTGSLKAASKHLATHMDGLLRVVATKMNHSGVYGRGGTVAAGAAVMSGLDLRT